MGGIYVLQKLVISSPAPDPDHWGQTLIAQLPLNGSSLGMSLHCSVSNGCALPLDRDTLDAFGPVIGLTLMLDRHRSDETVSYE
jgi:hypothetical protein